jgi:hypothetical protein
VPSTPHLNANADSAPDLFESESAALEKARAIHSMSGAEADEYRQSLGELIAHFERLMRETRRLIGRSDRAEREMQALAQQLAHRASHDALTGVLNRSAVIERAGKILRAKSAAMIVLDIDEFKRVNDDFGHPTGDAVILGVVDCLRRIVGGEGFKEPIRKRAGPSFQQARARPHPRSIPPGGPVFPRVCRA